MSAVIMLAIVGMWGAVLGPMWLRRHDAMLETRSVDRFSTAMRVLSRRPVPVGSRSLVLPVSITGGAIGPSVTVSGRAGDWLTTSTPPAAPRSGARGAHRVSAATYRRRRVLALLLATAVVTILPAALMSGGWLWVNLLVDALLALDLVNLRVTARRDAEVLVVLDRRARVGRTRTHEAAVPAPRRAGAEPVRTAAPEPVYVADPGLVAEQREAHAMAARVTSPVASSRGTDNGADREAAARVIDLTVPGAWREAAQADTVDQVVAELDVDDTAELDGLLDRRRVV